jgi:membrane fusion protein (multidrug efflux system)
MSQAQDGLFLAENAFVNADEAYKDTFLRAPFAGAVAVKDASLGVGDYLARGVRVARIINDSAFTMQLSVGERHVGLLRPGLPAVVETSAGRMEGMVQAVAAGSNEATGSFGVIVTWPNPGDGSLKAGMSARVTIDTSDAEETIVIPASSVLYRGGAPVVFVEEDGKSVPRPVTLGERLGDRQQVLSGLTPGEILIISGLASLAPDYPVTATLVGDSGGRS